MKLKSKLFFSYFFLIVLFSFSLFWLLLETRELTVALRGHVRQDVHTVIQVSAQLQHLEDLNTHYILLFIPAEQTQQKIINLEEARKQFSRGWEELQYLLNHPYQPAWYDKMLRHIYETVHWFQERPKGKAFDNQIDSLASGVSQRWQSVNSAISRSIRHVKAGQMDDARYLRDALIKNDIMHMRKVLAELNRVIGARGSFKSTEMALIAQKTQRVILITEVAIICVTLLVAFAGARKLTRPLESLKSAVDRMAIQDFDIKIEDKPNDEIGELGSAFEQLSTRLKEADSYKSAMLSQFTHEMKSPLGSIKQAVRLLDSSLGENARPEQKRFVSIIKGNNETLQKLITNILHSASYDAADIRLSYKPVNLVRLMTEVLVYLSPTIREKSIKVNLTFAAKEIIAEADAEKMQEVFQNLLGNAVKFSGEKTSIDVEIKQKFPLILISVKDQGIGIPTAEIPYIFEKMYRASNSRQISVKGTGLGLYITSQILRAHGGRISVSSEPGQGSLFKITLPRTRKVAEEGGWLS